MLIGLDKKKVAVVALLNNPNDLYRFTYIETHKYPEVEEYINQNLGALKQLFKEYGLEFVYIPELTHILTDPRFSDDAKYYAPWITTKRISELQQQFTTEIKTLYDSLICQSDEPALANSEGIAYTLNDFSKDNLEIQFQRLAADAKHLAIEESSLTPKEKARRFFDSYKSQFPDADIEDLFNDQIHTVKQSQRNPVVGSMVTSEEKGKEIISSLVIKDKRKPIITLPDYNNLDIELDATKFAFYTLFLNHPEGISFYELSNNECYYHELLRYYTPVTRFKAQSKIEETVKRMVAPSGTGTNNIQCTRIKEAINDALINTVYIKWASKYMINGQRKEEYSIEVARMGKVTLPKYD